MYSKEQRTREVVSAVYTAQTDYVPILVSGFLTDRKTQGLAEGTVEFYRWKLRDFAEYCEAQALTQVSEISPDFLRQYISLLQERHNGGGVAASFRSLRAFLYWVEAEEVIPGWKNPIRKLKAPRVATEPIEPISMDAFSALVKVCGAGTFTGERDRALFMVLLDTGVRAKELCQINTEDIDLSTGTIMVRQGKGRKPRVVFFGRKTRRAIRGYLRERKDNNPALWITRDGERLNYSALRDLMSRRAKQAGIKNPCPHDFRRAFALTMLRNGADIFALQRLMGHADLTVLRRYLAQTDADLQRAHDRGGPVDNL